ncbi:MAG TPA: Zn-dependent alcohol dehydrogenase [Pyrinomonadaceae bacterium]|jgi:S-(hydroxymethyl)glutathione dehydrogenase/alcohol dehydrogenase|nr:Zn-dependent alcohol dehydrogenase [Pyrinomonadaceae bacterium]
MTTGNAAMRIKAAILWEQGAPLSVEEAELEAPRAGEVLVEVKAAGVCHSDLHPARGDWPARTPLVLGHEGAGIVREVGPGVTRLRRGERVVFCWAPPCGACPPCLEGRPVLCDRLERTTYRNRLPAGGTRLSARGQPLAHFNGTACFADFAVVAEEGAIAVPADVGFEALATLGCAVITGVGAVMNAARVEAGARIVVIGAGGVGLNVVQGARLAACEKIIAVDTRSIPLKLAREFGATDTVEASTPDAAERGVRELTGGRGADYVFDTVGLPETLTQALAFTRKGGTVVLTGLARTDARAGFPLFPFVMQEKRLVGSVYGSGQPLRDIPRLVALHREGKLKLDELVTRTYRLDEVNDALAALASGEGARGIITKGGERRDEGGSDQG